MFALTIFGSLSISYVDIFTGFDSHGDFFPPCKKLTFIHLDNICSNIADKTMELSDVVELIKGMQ
jgi:hypothetical protein